MRTLPRAMQPICREARILIRSRCSLEPLLPSSRRYLSSYPSHFRTTLHRLLTPSIASADDLPSQVFFRVSPLSSSSEFGILGWGGSWGAREANNLRVFSWTSVGLAQNWWNTDDLDLGSLPTMKDKNTHMVATWDGSTQHVCVRVAATTGGSGSDYSAMYSSSRAVSTGPNAMIAGGFCIGANVYDGCSFPFYGDIWNVRIWKVAIPCQTLMS